MPKLAFALLAMLLLAGASPSRHEAATYREARALVVGIDRYQLPGGGSGRQLYDLGGATNDARTMAAVLAERGFRVELLIDAEATRGAIVAAFENFLGGDLRPGDELFFYFAGHGSQVATRDPQESDGLDETLVPVDAAFGVPDLTDGELERHYRRWLSGGARVTVVVDACHAGSSYRGLPGEARARFVERASASGVAPADAPGEPALDDARNFLVMAASQNDQKAFETEDRRHGLFSQALFQVLADPEPGETAAETLRRVAGLIMASGRSQRPLLAGDPERRARPLLGGGEHETRRGERPRAAAVVVAVDGGQVFLEGGMAQGLRPGDELGRGRAAIVLERVDPVTSVGRIHAAVPIVPGELFRRRRAGAHRPDLTVLAPASPLSAVALSELAAAFETRVRTSGRFWVSDPWAEAPSHVVRYRAGNWQLVDRSGAVLAVGALEQGRRQAALVGALPQEARVFLQLPLPAGAAQRLELGPGRRYDAIALVEGDEEEAMYQLVGRRDGAGRLLYAWSRSEEGHGAAGSMLPLRTGDLPHAAGPLFTDRLARAAADVAATRFWLTLEGAPEDRFPYRLGLADFTPAAEAPETPAGSVGPLRLKVGRLFGLRLALEGDQPARQRYLYVVLLGADGSRKLIFPRPGWGGDNHLPAGRQLIEDVRKIPLGPQPLLRISEPLGLETYVLLTTAEPIGDPMVLDDSIRREPRTDDHPLVRLLGHHQLGRRSPPSIAPKAWSIERLPVEVVVE